MTDTLTIAHFYHGPPESGHGGYTSGMIAAFLPDGPVEVTLRVPPPLDCEMSVEHDGASLRVLDDDKLVAEASVTKEDVTKDIPEPVSYSDAIVASIDYPGFKTTLTPSCFVCGKQREPHEGLRIFPGPVRGRDMVAAALVPESHVAGADGNMQPQFVWAALDCPSGWAVTEFVPGREAMLGRLTARIVKPVAAGRRYSVVGWRMRTEGRKMHSGSAIFDDAGAVCAAARATWIRVAS